MITVLVVPYGGLLISCRVKSSLGAETKDHYLEIKEIEEAEECEERGEY